MSVSQERRATVSLIFTIKNEESTLEDFFSSLGAQSRMPDEIIVVDGGSTDSSVELVKHFSRNCRTPCRLIVKRNANIPTGRNIAIRDASCEIIASTDAGCKLDSKWLENLISPFEKEMSVDVVSGWFEPDARSKFEKITAGLLFPRKDRVSRKSDKFLPSSRSIAFRKECWGKVSGYPEWLDTAEDSLFDLKLREAGYKFHFASDAVVYWRVRPNLKALFKQYFRYRKGDARAGLFFGRYWWPRVIGYVSAILLIILSFFSLEALLILVLGSAAYLEGQAFLTYAKTRLLSAVLVVPVVILTVDMAGFIGYFVGLLGRNKR